MENNIDWRVLDGLFRGFKPTERITVDEWADKYRYLSPVSSSEPGLWRTSRVPYAKEIMWQLSYASPAKEIIVMKGAQLAFTEIGLNWIGYTIDIDPAPMLIVMGTEDALRKNTKTRIDPMIKDSHRLSQKIPPAKQKTGENNMFEKSYEGGILLMAGANSATGLRSMPIKKLMLDEVDSYPGDLNGEGSPVALAEARTSNFPTKKIYKISTPTIKGESLIEKEYETTDKRMFFLPCPECGTQQALKWEQVGWEVGKGNLPTKVWYECEHCHAHIDEMHKNEMLAHGEWIATAPENENPERVGYYISSLYSPYGWYSWKDMVTEYLRALNDDVKMKTFWNTRLGLPFANKGEAPNWEVLMNRTDAYERNKPPKSVVFLTAGVDVQQDRLELEIVGWGRNRESWSIDYRVITGDTAAQDVWDKLALVVHENWIREDGCVLPLMMMGVDCGFATSEVYNFVSKFSPSRVVAMKGQGKLDRTFGNAQKLRTDRSGQTISNSSRHAVSSDMLKSELYGYLRLHRDENGQCPFGYCHFPQGYSANYYKGLTAEVFQEVTRKNGQVTYEWVKLYRRNEPLDTRVYARAAAALYYYDSFTEQHFAAIEAKYMQNAPTPIRKKRDKSEKSTSFWD